MTPMGTAGEPTTKRWEVRMQNKVRKKFRLNRAAYAFLCLVLAAACADQQPTIGSMTKSLCNCNRDPKPCCCASPILLDIAGDGFQLTSWEDGVKVATRPG